MSNSDLLIIEDDRDIRELLEYNLRKERYEVTGAAGGEEGLRLARSRRFDLILLDLMLPEIDGLEICKALKSEPATASTPIIMVTAKGEEADIIIGLELGADDYIVKPFSPKVLAARIRSVLRRKSSTGAEKEKILAISGLTIHPGKREVRIGDKPITLTFTEFELLYYLANHPGWVFTRYQLVNAVKGEDYAVTDRSVDVQIVGLRKKLGVHGGLIETIRGVGYRFSESSFKAES